MQLTQEDLNKMVEAIFKEKNFRKVVKTAGFPEKIKDILQKAIAELPTSIGNKEFDEFLKKVEVEINKSGKFRVGTTGNYTKHNLQHGDFVKQLLQVALKDLVADKHHIPRTVPTEVFGVKGTKTNPEIQKIIDKPSPPPPEPTTPKAKKP